VTDVNASDLLCRELVELVTDYLGDALTVQERARFEQHLLECPPCTDYLAQMKTTIELAGDLGKPNPGEPLEQSLLEVFRGWHQKK
jgi:putative zinc finger protein